MMAEQIDVGPTHHAFADELTGFQRDLLYTILDGAEGENYGLGIKQRLEADYGWTGEDGETDHEKEIHTSRLYNELNRLVDKGLVEKEAVDRRKNAYALTERGRACVQTHCDWVVEKAMGGGER